MNHGSREKKIQTLTTKNQLLTFSFFTNDSLTISLAVSFIYLSFVAFVCLCESQ